MFRQVFAANFLTGGFSRPILSYPRIRTHPFAFVFTDIVFRALRPTRLARTAGL